MNEQLPKVSLEADFLFIRCIPHLDREGRMKGSPKMVKAIAVPARDELTVERVAACLGELAAQELVVWYQVGEAMCLAFPGFERHQTGMKKDREAESRIPSPRSPNAVHVTPDQIPIWSGPVSDQVPLREVEVKCSSSEEIPTGDSPQSFPQETFDQRRERLKAELRSAS